MEALGRRPATPTEFRNAVRMVAFNGTGAVAYTDKAHNSKNKSKRYVAIKSYIDLSDKEIHDIETILWMVGATANTRQGFRFIRGTCAV
jgi:hypothetical protein